MIIVLINAGRYFHAYRIDHVLGFFRIWEIPADCTTGLLGHFRPSIPISRSELESSGIWDMDRYVGRLQAECQAIGSCAKCTTAGLCNLYVCLLEPRNAGHCAI